MFLRRISSADRVVRSRPQAVLRRAAVETLEGRLLLSASLDPTFGSGGIVKGPGVESYEVEVQSDGKLLIADEKGLIRYNVNGSLDTSFGGGDGIADWGGLADPGTPDARPAIALQADGKIIAAASDNTSGLVVVRFNSDGSRDITFGTNGEVKPTSGAGFWDVADVDIVGGGRLLIGGGNNPRPFFNDFSITRLNADGTPDTTFGGGDGRIDRSIRAYDDLEGLLVQRDGKIIAFGNSATATTGTQVPEPDQWTASLFRLHGDGSLDTSFGNVGKVELNDDEVLMDAELQSTGKIVLLTDSGVEVRRLNPNGTLDLTFGENGRSGIGVSTNTSFDLIEGNDLLVRGDDSILVGGHTMTRIMPGETLRSENAAVGKLFADGEQDGSFGGGFLNLDFGGNRDDIHALALQSGKIIAAGVAANTDGTRTNVVARITESGGSGGTGNGTGLRGEYFNNMDFTAPVFTRTDPTVNFNWGSGSPDPRIQPDTFSVRWSGQIEATGTGRYTFYTTSDDGVRLTVNGQRIIDKLTPQATTRHFGDIDLVAGQKYDITLEYFDRFGGANAKLEWSGPGIATQVVPAANLFSAGGSSTDTQAPTAPPNFHVTLVRDDQITVSWEAASDNVGVAGYEIKVDSHDWVPGSPDQRGAAFVGFQPGSTHTISVRAFDAAGNRGPASTVTATTTGGGNTSGLKGEYFNNSDFTAPVLTRTDANINFNWGTGSPAPGVDPDSFSVRWSGKIEVPTTGRYTFHTTTDDGVRLFVNGERLIDKLAPQSATEWSGSIDLVAGQKYDIVMEYFERAGSAQAKLSWSGPGIAKQVIPPSAFGTTGGSSDTQAPTAVSDFRPTRIGSNEIDLQWNGARDNVGLAGYELRIGDNAPIILSPGALIYTARNLQSNTPYRFQLTAFDEAGNRGPTSTIHVTTRSTDAQAPSAVPNFRAVRVTDQDIELAWDPASDNFGVDRYEIFPDRQSDPLTVRAGQPLGWLFGNYDGGSTHTYTIRAVDADGNIGPSTTITVTTRGGTPGNGNGLKGEYFNNPDFTAPVLAHTDSNVNFDWGTGSPAAGVESDTFSVRWTGWVEAFNTGFYQFHTTTDDGVRLWVNGKQIINQFVPQPATEHSGGIALIGGQKYEIRMEYFERSAGAKAQLSWIRPGMEKQVIPQSQLYSGLPADTTPPSAAPYLAARSISSQGINIVWEHATDNMAVTGYILQLDDGVKHQVDELQRFWSWGALQPNTSHVVKVTAFDAAGNFGPVKTLAFTTTSA